MYVIFTILYLITLFTLKIYQYHKHKKYLYALQLNSEHVIIHLPTPEL